ncbi:hypothetical protein DPMN_126847 [Dreissena polymorpha]|uniref:Uncharacterized protein n=1 Tax=Dreissena polymorpha TaxID=45954 RepID=A0A9D4H078_DREPO|nr:hypothetical protein DPMN_126847 [Dreissena polymorpha]
MFGNKEVSYVTGCACCKDNGITVVGTVKDFSTLAPLSGMSVSIDMNGTGVSDGTGLFKASIPAATQVVIQVTDPSGKYIAAVKVSDLPATYRGTLYAEIKMIKAAAPVTVNPSVDNALSISADPQNLDQVLLSFLSQPTLSPIWQEISTASQYK